MRERALLRKIWADATQVSWLSEYQHSYSIYCSHHCRNLFIQAFTGECGSWSVTTIYSSPSSYFWACQSVSRPFTLLKVTWTDSDWFCREPFRWGLGTRLVKSGGLWWVLWIGVIYMSRIAARIWGPGEGRGGEAPPPNKQTTNGTMYSLKSNWMKLFLHQITHCQFRYDVGQEGCDPSCLPWTAPMQQYAFLI